MSTKELIVHVTELQVGDKLMACGFDWDKVSDTSSFSRWSGSEVLPPNDNDAYFGYELHALKRDYQGCHFMVLRVVATRDGDPYMKYIKGQGWVYE